MVTSLTELLRALRHFVSLENDPRIRIISELTSIISSFDLTDQSIPQLLRLPWQRRTTSRSPFLSWRLHHDFKWPALVLGVLAELNAQNFMWKQLPSVRLSVTAYRRLNFFCQVALNFVKKDSVTVVLRWASKWMSDRMARSSGLIRVKFGIRNAAWP